MNAQWADSVGGTDEYVFFFSFLFFLPAPESVDSRRDGDRRVAG